jgi:carbon monoxide dehydrogenase subunit G
MDITGEYRIPAPRSAVWAALNDPEMLKACIPGCEEMEKKSDTRFTVKVTTRIGAVNARFSGNVELSDIDAPNAYTISGHGQGGVAGFAKGGARVTLADVSAGGTLLRYQAKAELGGKLAAVGSRMLQGVAKNMADKFFGAFVARLGGVPAEPAAAAVAAALGAQATAPSAASYAGEAARPAAARALDSGTLRDLVWFVLGVAVGAVVTWALLLP